MQNERKNHYDQIKKSIYEEAHEQFIRKCKVHNLSELTLTTYNNHYNIFVKMIDATSAIMDVTSTTVDDFIIYLRENYKVNNVL